MPDKLPPRSTSLSRESFALYDHGHPATALASLTLAHNSRLESLAGLPLAPKMYRLELSGNPAIEDYGALDGLREIERLILRGPEAPPLSSFAQLQSAVALILTDIEGMTTLDGLPPLGTLNWATIARNPQLANIDVLTGVQVTQSLRLFGNAALPRELALAWANASMHPGAKVKVAGNLGGPEIPLADCPWKEDDECDEEELCEEDREDCYLRRTVPWKPGALPLRSGPP